SAAAKSSPPRRRAARLQHWHRAGAEARAPDRAPDRPPPRWARPWTGAGGAAAPRHPLDARQGTPLLANAARPAADTRPPNRAAPQTGPRRWRRRPRPQACAADPATAPRG